MRPCRERGWQEVAGGREGETRFVSSIPECDKRNEIMKGELPPDCRYAFQGAYQLLSGDGR